LLVWDDELYEVNAANGGGQRHATMHVGDEFGKAFGQEFGKGFGQEFGKQIGKEIGKKLGQFVWVAIMMCGILFAILLKSM
jgi:tetrahydromethanopterin S-methyltransferase subunit G